MLIKKGDLVKHTFFSFTGIVVRTHIGTDKRFCEVYWQINPEGNDLLINKKSQQRVELIHHLEILNREKVFQER